MQRTASIRTVLASIVVLSSVGMVRCLPDPQSVAERRASFPRDDLRGDRGWVERVLDAVGLSNAPERLILDELPSGTERVDAEFGRAVRLLGYRMEPEKPAPGDRLKVTFYWSAIQEVAEDYQVFVHGDAIGGQGSRLHGDHFPALGRYPTDVWQVGEIVVDPFTLWIPPGYGAPQLGIHTGLYKGDYRVPLTAPGRAPSGTDNRSQAITITFR